LLRNLFLLFFLMTAVLGAQAQTIPIHAEGLSEELIEVPIDGGTQKGVLSKRKDQTSATKLIVLLPGYPSVVRPEMGNGVMMNSPLLGNFLIRARRHLLDGKVMTLLVDCHTSIGDVCKPEYQSTKDRFQHVKALIDAAKIKVPSIDQVYLYSTSAGSISSAFIARYLQKELAGVIHSATIDPTAPKSYPQLTDFDYLTIKVPQAFVHHADDPCLITSFAYVQKISEKYKLPLVSVSGGSDFSGNPCGAFTQHGFRNKEVIVMKHVLKMIQSETWISEKL